jgi:enterochelin esterase-like enzyme
MESNSHDHRNGCTETRGHSNPNGEWKYEDFFFQEFMPFVEKTYRIKADKRFRAVAGLSWVEAQLLLRSASPELFSQLP